MNITRAVNAKLKEYSKEPEYDLKGALAEAEKLADEFASIQPEPYVVPIERFAGLPVYQDNNKL